MHQVHFGHACTTLAARAAARIVLHWRHIMANRTYRPAQAGVAMGGVWLIGLGIIFLVQQLLDIPWGRAWPLFLILAGVALAIRWALGWGPRYGQSAVGGLIGPLILIGLGVVFLLQFSGLWDVSFGQLWPIALLVIGALLLLGAFLPGSRRAPAYAGVERSPSGVDRLALDLEGVTDAEVRLRFGAGELRLGAGSPDKLVEGDFDGGVAVNRPMPNRVDLQPDTDSGRWPWAGEKLDWRIGLSPTPILDLRFEGGASRSELDLRELRVRRLDVKTGASQTTVWLPVAAGVTSVSADAGAAQLVFHVPDGVAASIRSQMVIGATDVDQSRFPSSGSGRFESLDYAGAANRVELDVRGGMGNVTIR
jgi:hypothetical protein